MTGLINDLMVVGGFVSDILISWKDVISAGAASISALIAAWALIHNINHNKKTRRFEIEEKMLNQAFDNLRWGYEELISNNVDIDTPPVADRLSWLTAARSTVKFYDAKSEISNEALKALWGMREEYWRHKFYKALDFAELNQPSYFSQGGGNQIDKRSAYIIILFSQWSDDVEDPIDRYNQLTWGEAAENLRGAPARGFRYYLENQYGGKNN